MVAKVTLNDRTKLVFLSLNEKEYSRSFGLINARYPEYIESEFDFIIGKACYLQNPETFIWERILS